jgi:arylsulfatase A-like enzyme
MELPLEEITLAELFKENGYTTCHIGKWHLGGEGFEPQKQGFDINIGGDHTGTPLSYFAPFQNKQGRAMPGLEKAEKDEYLPDRLTTEAEKFLDANREKPFFLYFPHYTVHTPLKAKPETIAKYPGKLELGKQSNPTYAAMIESMDDSIGRVLKKIDDLKLTQKTVILFTSDNGGLATIEGMGTPSTINSPLREGKGFLYEGGIRVPLLVKWPTVTLNGSVTTHPVSSVDFYPTLAEMCGLKFKQAIDGVSFAPVLRGDKKEPRPIYWHYPHYANQGSRPSAAIRSGEWKLIEFYETGRKELFNVVKDVSESQNQSEKEPEIVKDLAAKLEAWRKEVNAQMPSANPNYLPNPQAKDGTISIHARTAQVYGTQLRYEPLPHKMTLGFWTRQEDYATFEFTVSKPGKFTVEILQGCGKGSGGSEVEFTFGDQKLTTKVEDTGGFQNFKAREIGMVELKKEGRHTLTVKAKTKPGVAVMDLRSVTLKGE